MQDKSPTSCTMQRFKVGLSSRIFSGIRRNEQGPIHFLESLVSTERTLDWMASFLFRRQSRRR